MTRPYFATEKISDFHTFAKHADHLITVLDRLAASPTPSLANKHGAVDVQELFGRFTLDSATEFLMGGSIVRFSLFCWLPFLIINDSRAPSTISTRLSRRRRAIHRPSSVRPSLAFSLVVLNFAPQTPSTQSSTTASAALVSAISGLLQS